MFPNGISVKDGFEMLAGNETVTYFNGLNVTGNFTAQDLAKAKELASKNEYTVAVISESSYTEKVYGDINDLALPAGQIEYVNELATMVASNSEVIDVSVVVTNSGSVDGKDPAVPFNLGAGGDVTKEITKVDLQAGKSATVNFTLSADDWSVYYPQIGSGLKQVAEDAEYVIDVKPDTACDVYNETAIANPLCASSTLNTGNTHTGLLSATLSRLRSSQPLAYPSGKTAIFIADDQLMQHFSCLTPCVLH
ncbi:unnamed protein product [Phytophthora lilii]|uniref:Unnamed protein product n=1 Tax=Phytophthora lilii TaxID=2077276 RepID=A0A9W6U6H3_9STRA|nr:unnamed protein product [Phytophthora lilii]